jgi:hypothetical protein
VKAFPQVRGRSRLFRSTGTRLVLISRHEGEGRGFSPAVTGLTDCSPASPPAQLAAASSAGGEGKGARMPRIAAGLKPRPSGATGEPPCAGEKSGLGTVRETPCPAQKTKNRGNEAKESLKTKEVAKTRCAKRSHICARKAANEAKRAAFRCKSRTSSGGIRLSQLKSPPDALCIAWIGRAQTCQRTACLMPHPLGKGFETPLAVGGLKGSSQDRLGRLSKRRGAISLC